MERIKQLIQGDSPAVRPESMLRAINDPYSRQVLNSAGLVVSGTVTLFKTANTIYAMVNGIPVRKTTADFPALTGYNLTSAQVGGFVATMDAAGTLYALPIAPAATFAGIVFPTVPANQVVIGQVLLNLASAATFTGGTTDVTASAAIVYVNQVGPFYPMNAIV